MLKSGPTAMDVEKLIMLYNDGNVDNKFQSSILNSSGKNHTSLLALQTDYRTDKHTYLIIE